tara:strand:- start:1268 stop:3343 length:2076 start_codon:yes stop_codon:yes gene_type:complete
MAPVIRAISESQVFAPVVISTGQHKEMLTQVLQEFNLSDKIEYELSLMRPKQRLAQLTSSGVQAIDGVLQQVRPDFVLVQGDTTTAFVTALAAFYLKIPVGHIEAGLRTHNIYSPFPEEVNRKCISVMATYHFAPTEYAAQNLRNEGADTNVFVTGNTVVDAVYDILKRAPSSAVQMLLNEVQSSVASTDVKLIILTAHRRENLGQPLLGIFSSIEKLLLQFENVVVLYPTHMNPIIKELAITHFGHKLFSALTSMSSTVPKSVGHLNRFLIVPPIDHADLVFLMNTSFFVMTDSGGIQEEAVTLGKPVLILRDTTERPEGVLAGAAKLVGYGVQDIVKAAATLLQDSNIYEAMSGSRHIFGDGTAAQKIVHFLEEGVHQNHSLEHLQTPDSSNPFDLVIVITVWKRDTIDKMLEMTSRQSTLPLHNPAILVVQNGVHLNIKDSLKKWEMHTWVGGHPKIYHVHSHIETGYYGRFLTPMFVQTTLDANFIVLDDDILFGSRYFENLLRVVNDGFLATRNGRLLDENLTEFDNVNWAGGPVDTFDEDDEYDFGGHIWAGKVEWLQTAFRNPPPLFYNAEDFWISAVLKMNLGIGTKRARCPHPDEGDLEFCACSMKEAFTHIAPELGSIQIDEGTLTRVDAIRSVAAHYSYIRLLTQRTAEEVERRHKGVDMSLFRPKNETFHMFQQCLYWS